MPALDLRTPGVYVQEVSIFPPSVVSVATAIPAFLGYTTKAKGTIARITSMNDFVANFGGPANRLTIDLTAPVLPATEFSVTVAANQFNLYYAMQMYFANGGGPCWVVSTGEFTVPGGPHIDHFWNASKTGALNTLELEDEPTLIVMPDLRLLTGANQYLAYQKAMDQCNRLQDRFTIIDLPSTPSDFRGATGIGTLNLKYGAAYYPDLVTSLSCPPEAVKFSNGGAHINTTITMAELIASTDANISGAWLAVEKGVRQVVGKHVISLPPSSTIAGVYAAVDRDRGVWKAPANVSVTGVVKPSVTITHDDQLTLNVDPTGKSINAIRAFTGKGILVWGARTLAGNDNEWRYVPVRRLFIMVEESIRKATEFVVFEPNDANTWLKVKTMIENFLTNLWKDGALAGATPKDAFFVKVGLNQTMTAQDILEGKLIVEIGMAAVRPAEFIVLKFSHKLQES